MKTDIQRPDPNHDPNHLTPDPNHRKGVTHQKARSQASIDFLYRKEAALFCPNPLATRRVVGNNIITRCVFGPDGFDQIQRSFILKNHT
jgi:hypothetical protein